MYSKRNWDDAVIVLPADQKLRAQLELKLAEYRQRLATGEEWMREDSIAKIGVLERLLRDGTVAFADLTAEFYLLVGRDTLITAFGITERYVLGKHNYGGTGLPKVVAA
jgi:hypothetical protein